MKTVLIYGSETWKTKATLHKPQIFLHSFLHRILYTHRLAGLVVEVYASEAEDLGFKSRLRLNFSGLSHTSDLKIGTPVATLPGAWHYRVSTGTGRPGVNIL